MIILKPNHELMKQISKRTRIQSPLYNEIYATSQHKGTRHGTSSKRTGRTNFLFLNSPLYDTCIIQDYSCKLILSYYRFIIFISNKPIIFSVFFFILFSIIRVYFFNTVYASESMDAITGKTVCHQYQLENRFEHRSEILQREVQRELAARYAARIQENRKVIRAISGQAAFYQHYYGFRSSALTALPVTPDTPCLPETPITTKPATPDTPLDFSFNPAHPALPSLPYAATASPVTPFAAIDTAYSTLPSLPQALTALPVTPLNPSIAANTTLPVAPEIQLLSEATTASPVTSIEVKNTSPSSLPNSPFSPEERDILYFQQLDDTIQKKYPNFISTFRSNNDFTPLQKLVKYLDTFHKAAFYDNNFDEMLCLSFIKNIAYKELLIEPLDLLSILPAMPKPHDNFLVHFVTAIQVQEILNDIPNLSVKDIYNIYEKTRENIYSFLEDLYS